MKIDSLIDNISSENTTKKIVLNTQETVKVVDSGDITRCESDGSYCKVYFNDSKMLISKKLKAFEEILSGLTFFRVHRSHLVNLKHVDRYDKRDGGFIRMRNGDTVPLSVNKKEEFFNLLETQI